MFIKRVSLYDFGRLSGTINFEPNRCNIICQQNEFGKTTILDAVLYTLYNFPTAGFSRDTLKPKDRYRPWNGSGKNGGFVVELELRDVAGRNYQLRADFNRQQPFTLHDADTLQPIPLDGMTFGQRYLRMSLPSFTQCFFLRQDEKQGSGKNQLVSVIEEAAASNQREAPSNVSEALDRLASPRINAPGFCDENILPKNLIKRLQDQKARLAAELDTLKQELDRHRGDVESAGELDERIAAIENQIVQWNHGLLQVRRREKQVLLNRYNEGREAANERQRLMTELEPFAVIDTQQRPQVVTLLSDWKMARERLEEARNELASDGTDELSAAEADLAGYPETASQITPEDIEALRNARSTITDRQAQFARHSSELQTLESTLREQGVPLDRLADLHEAETSLSPADREIIFEHNAAHTEAQAALVNLEQNALTAREQVNMAKSRRSWFANLGMGLTGLVVAFMVVGIVFLLTGNDFFGWVSLIVAAVIGAGATLYVTAMRSRISAQELDPAIETEMALSAESRKIREQLESIETEYDETLERLGLTPDRVVELREMNQWQQAAAPWTAARDAVDRLRGELNTTLDEARPRIARITSPLDESTDAGDSAVLSAISDAIAAADRYISTSARATSLREKNSQLTSEVSRLETDFHTKQDALAKLVESDLTRELPGLEEKAQAFLDGCDKALQLQTLRQEYGAVQAMSPEEVEALQESLKQLDEDIAAMPADQPAHETQSDLSSDEIERRLSDARRNRDELREHRNRGFREAEKAVNDWRTRGPELDDVIAKVDVALKDAIEFAEACELAGTELSTIANEVYTQWATALNESINHIMPMINDRYTQIALSQELDLSVYSHEAGRRLETKDVQHLSKGARDQLLLAVRIAIAEFLSAHVGNLPLALDEPFAHWDDQRFVEGMRFLTKLSERHQVILLSCHHWRYDQLRETAPDVFDRVVFNELIAQA